MNASVQSVFSSAGEIDRTLVSNSRQISRLAEIQVPVEKFSREQLFRNMADGKSSLFSSFPTPLTRTAKQKGGEPWEAVLSSFKKSRSQKKIRVRTGSRENLNYYNIRELAAKWERNVARMNVTDFHFRDTYIENTIDTKKLSRFNLYPRCSDDVSFLEMMTLVVSTQTGFSDSHSDDSDGSNHCFTGKKLWLAWDTLEGMSNGLEDLDKQDVHTRCRFDLNTFLRLKSSHWLVIESGETLFMPGHLTHKVVTLEPYLGVGSFYFALPNALRTLCRWTLHGANWKNQERQGYEDTLFPPLVKMLNKKVQQLESASLSTQQTWGADFLRYSINSWKNSISKRDLKRFCDSKLFLSLDPTLKSQITA